MPTRHGGAPHNNKVTAANSSARAAATMAAAGRINHLGNRRGSATLGAVFALGSHVEVDPFTNDGGGGGRLSAGCVGGTEAVGHT